MDRARLIGSATTLCTATALLVCTVIAVLVLSAFLNFDASVAVALLFVAGAWGTKGRGRVERKD